MASWLGAISRQMHTARAISFTCEVKDSITTGPGADILERRGDILPVYLPGAGHAAIVLTGMEVEDAIKNLADGCAAMALVPWEAERPDGYRTLFERLDAVVLERGVRDAADATVPGFPYLKANRFVASLAGGLSEHAAKAAWAEWMRELDLAAREKEITYLPDDSVKTLAASRDALAGRARTCSQTLYDADRVRPDFHEVLIPRVAVPDEYSNALRLIGLYPLVTIPEYKITEGVRERFRAWYEMPYEKLPAVGTLRTYRPPPGTRTGAREVIAASRLNPLGIPRPSAGEARELALRYAPVIIQDDTAPHDRVGRIAWKGDALTVDGDKPAVYYYLSHARVKNGPVLQINYVFWYAARAGNRSPFVRSDRPRPGNSSPISSGNRMKRPV